MLFQVERAAFLAITGRNERGLNLRLQNTGIQFWPGHLALVAGWIASASAHRHYCNLQAERDTSCDRDRPVTDIDHRIPAGPWHAMFSAVSARVVSN